MNLKFEDLELYELGNQIEIAGMLMQGSGKTLAVFFPKSDIENPDLVEMSEEDWKKFLLQVDTLETVLFPNKAQQAKTVVRKSQRNIEQGISWNVFRRDNYTCRYCAADNVPLTVDHLVLWENMGQSLEDNLLSACRKCNKTRGNMEFEDWVKTDFYKNKINNFSDPLAAHNYNLSFWSKAQKLPLRKAQRSR